MYIRLLNSTVEPLSNVFSPIYNSLPGSVTYEIQNYLKNFEIVDNTVILTTSSYNVFCPVQFNYNTNTYSLLSNNAQYLSCAAFGLNMSNPWYSQSNKTTFISRLVTTTIYTTISSQIIYPEIYSYTNNNLKKIYPPDTTVNTLSIFSLANTGYNLNFVIYEAPVLSYNSLLDQYCISYVVRDPSRMLYVINNYYKYNTNIYNMNATLFKPHCFCHSENFVINQSFTSIANSFFVGETAPTFTSQGLNIT